MREGPAESEEEDESKKKSRIADATGQKRKEAAATPSHSRAKAKVADPVGSKRKSSKGAEATPSPIKTKMTEQTGEKRKADSDAEDVEEAGPGSPLRSRVGEDEDLRRVTTALHSTYNILQLHSDLESIIISEAGEFGMTAMDLGRFGYRQRVEQRKDYRMGSRGEACIYHWKTTEQSSGTYSVYMWAIPITDSRRHMVRT